MADIKRRLTVVVVGGGASGMMAAGTAARCGAKVILLEKNPRLGRKLMITGKGRCNLTNSRDIDDFIENYPSNGAFLYSALHAYSNRDLMETITRLGVSLKEERGGRVFPVSDKSIDIVRALEGYARKSGAAIRLGEPVRRLVVDRNSQKVIGVETDVDEYRCDAVVVATGGMSYPATGSTGDGFRWAEELGHTIAPIRPSLVPLETKEEWLPQLQGVSLRNVKVKARVGEEVLGEEFGEMLFTHFGVSGPTILSLSGYISRFWKKKKREVVLQINLKPALTPEHLDRRIQRDLFAAGNRRYKNSLGELLPRALIPVIVELSGVPAEKTANQVTKEERKALAYLLQHLTVTAVRPRPIEEAIITAGGVSVKEIDPRTMASRLWEGLYFAGELIDVDGYTGGFNLQAAFSTGFVAGKASAAREE